MLDISLSYYICNQQTWFQHCCFYLRFRVSAHQTKGQLPQLFLFSVQTYDITLRSLNGITKYARLSFVKHSPQAFECAHILPTCSKVMFNAVHSCSMVTLVQFFTQNRELFSRKFCRAAVWIIRLSRVLEHARFCFVSLLLIEWAWLWCARFWAQS